MSVRVAGDNSSKQLGLGDTTDRKTFTTQSGTSFAHLVTGSLSCLGIKKDGTLWYWGTVTGYGSATSPTQIESGTTWASVAAGGASFYVIKTDGTLWVLGYNGSGQLGLGDTTDRASLTQVGSGTNWHFVAGGSNHALAIKTDGTDKFVGSIMMVDTDSSGAVSGYAHASSNDVINLNGTTTGGIAGSWIEITAVDANKYFVTGILLGSGSVATPFADA
jgi:alpha-tubulin suppressor-like RCC1 family protein